MILALGWVCASLLLLFALTCGALAVADRTRRGLEIELARANQGHDLALGEVVHWRGLTDQALSQTRAWRERCDAVEKDLKAERQVSAGLAHQIDRLSRVRDELKNDALKLLAELSAERKRCEDLEQQLEKTRQAGVDTQFVVDGAQAQYQCSHCRLRFPTVSGLRHHLDAAHPRELNTGGAECQCGPCKMIREGKA